MCGRFVVAEVGSELVSVLRVDLVAENLPAPSWNVAPTAQAAIVLDSVKTEPPTRRLESARWGLVPSWAKDPSVGARAFNARSEELEDKPMFRSAFENRRAVIPASGYYEWHTGPEGKQPYYIHPADDEPLFFAGLYEWWRDPAKADDDPTRWLLSFTILTRASAGPLADIHDRMPVVLDVDYADAWLDPTVDYQRDVLQAAYDAAPELSDTFEIRPVGSAVGNVRNDSPSLILPLPA
ncbi:MULTISPECIES: SOS response-associated peptidase [Microbacterium]|uniref:SOS response-associated peptidase n=1 Tax=Microbacterium TaxID=33882 RepID=UPI001E522231|nr:SOS response-associated peptidase [Microbacterium nymphoidis]MCD2499231.1 SOS response-associated peptidase [Microbacterium nymphoidis]